MWAFKLPVSDMQQFSPFLWRAVKNLLVSGVAALLTFVSGSIAWISFNSHAASVHDFTLWPVLWLAIAVFAVTFAVSQGAFLLRKILNESV